MGQNMIQLPQEMYEAVRQRAAAQRKTAETLVIEWVSSYLETEDSGESETIAAFEQEVAAFAALKPALLTEYAGQYVAIYRGSVVASGEDKLAVSRQVREQYGVVPYYVELVAEDAPRTVRIPSSWVIGP